MVLKLFEYDSSCLNTVTFMESNMLSVVHHELRRHTNNVYKVVTVVNEFFIMAPNKKHLICLYKPYCLVILQNVCSQTHWNCAPLHHMLGTMDVEEGCIRTSVTFCEVNFTRHTSFLKTLYCPLN